jgi:hypothetical protein
MGTCLPCLRSASSMLPSPGLGLVAQEQSAPESCHEVESGQDHSRSTSGVVLVRIWVQIKATVYNIDVN